MLTCNKRGGKFGARQFNNPPQLTPYKTHNPLHHLLSHFTMGKRRRKVSAVLSEEEAPPTPRQHQPEADVAERHLSSELSELSGIDSDSGIPLANKKKPRLDAEAQQVGELPSPPWHERRTHLAMT